MARSTEWQVSDRKGAVHAIPKNRHPASIKDDDPRVLLFVLRLHMDRHPAVWHRLADGRFDPITDFMRVEHGHVT